MNENVVSEIPLHGGQLHRISERFSIPISDLIDFSANINPDGVPPSLLPVLRASLGDHSILTSYPDLENASLKHSIATHSSLAPEQLVVANGFVPLFECALRTLNIKRCLLPLPAFVEYRRSLENSGVEVLPHYLTPFSGFLYDVRPLVDGTHDAIVLANPQNPSGALTRKRTLLDLVRDCADRNIKVFLDEAFIDYAPIESLTQDVEQFSNLIVFRSVTKFYGMPGLRVAYAAANQSLAKSLNEKLPPWPITSLAALAATVALKDEPFAIHTRSLNEARKAQLIAGLKGQGLQPYPSAANYLLFRLPASVSPQTFWKIMILEHHLVLRDCSNYEGLPRGHFRCAVRTESENEALVQGISKVLFESYPVLNA